ncbi:hypothetical protein IWX90DRAFT_19217 [Phyllosticta citrichinensis]|uniref:Secreted protein n=1 Tax=Phyllosticta citrichinensis TaxID=1130410 RepID=A0ABR1Y691_9PEZI
MCVTCSSFFSSVLFVVFVWTLDSMFVNPSTASGDLFAPPWLENRSVSQFSSAPGVGPSTTRQLTATDLQTPRRPLFVSFRLHRLVSSRFAEATLLLLVAQQQPRNPSLSPLFCRPAGPPTARQPTRTRRRLRLRVRGMAVALLAVV